MLHKKLTRHMVSVEDYRHRLANLQGAWDTLSLLSHLGGDGSDLSGTRQAFESLAADLIDSLSGETCKKSLLALRARTQIAIDILVRNLFERTADVGFLSADDDLCAYLRDVEAARCTGEDMTARSERIRRRLREYVAKYSVYKDIVLLSPTGEVVLALQSQAERSNDPLIRATLETRAAYLETYRCVDFQPQQARSLIYSYRIVDQGTARGVLCLSFDLEDEVRRIFAQLAGVDWAVFTFADGEGNVIASSDPWQIPIGAPLPVAFAEEGSVIRFAGREYLAITRRTQGYQGYMGPGWCAHAMVPLEHAFAAQGGTTSLDQRLLEELCDSDLIFSAELRRIPRQARAIQRELNRSVWNGHVRLDAARTEGGTAFAKALLWEIGNAGRRTQDTFERSILDLQGTVTSAIIESAQLLASLAVDILDRNLYERANDCRWWALNATLIEHLSGSSSDVERVTSVLRHINSLYTVYHTIVLFDMHRRIVAVSNPAQAHLVGTTCEESWVAEALQLRDSQAFCVSPFAPSKLYGDQHTFIFAAALHNTQHRTVGGIGIVFDTGPQLLAMLKDALPRSEGAESVGVFVNAERRALAATSLYQPGEVVDLPRELLEKRNEANACVIEHRGMHYAAAACATSGYREYDRVAATAVVLIPLGPRRLQARAALKPPTLLSKRGNTADQLLEIATFTCGEQWLGILREEIVEAVAASGIRSVPGKPAWHAGLLMHQGNPLAVVDLALLTGHSSKADARDVIVIQTSHRKQRVGLLVDELASIPEIAAHRILPLTDYTGRASTRIIDRAVRPHQPDDPVLLMLNIEQLMAHVRCEVGAAVSAQSASQLVG